MKRREFLKMAGGLIAVGSLTGCMETLGMNRRSSYDLPPSDGINVSKYSNTYGSYPRKPQPKVIPEASNGQAYAISRDVWSADAPITSRLNSMGKVDMITVHHEGNPQPTWETSVPEVCRSLHRIQREHRKRMHAGDIGYHYVIDRAGRIWEGRNICYQGAHVSRHNPHNIGIMLMGNFDIQRPSTEQLASLKSLGQTLVTGYGLNASHFCSHCDLASTRCPGKNLKSQIPAIRYALKYS